MSERLQKYLARAGVASRRHAEELITAGRVQVNNQTVTELGSKVTPGTDLVTVDGKLVSPPESNTYLLFYKPPGVVTTLEDPQGRPTVKHYLSGLEQRVFPVGRLDYDAEGGILLTDDGELAHKLMHPSFQVPRTYLAKVKGTPDEATLEKLRGGVRLEDGIATPKSVEIFEQVEKNTWLKLVVTEGRQHLIKRLCAAVGHPVVRLYRPSYAGVSAQGLRPGEVRPLTPEEVRALQAAASGAEPAEPEIRLPPRRHGHGPAGLEEEDEGAEVDETPRPKAAARPKAGPRLFAGVVEGGNKPPRRRPGSFAPEGERGGFERRERPSDHERGPRREGKGFERRERPSGPREGGDFGRERGPRREGGGFERRERPSGPREGGGFDRERGPRRKGGGFERRERPSGPREGGGFDRERGPRREGGGFERRERPSGPREGGFGRERGPRREGGGFERRERPSGPREGGFGRERGPRREGGGFERRERPSGPREGGGFGRERGPRREGGGFDRRERPSGPSEGGFGRERGPRREGGGFERRERPSGPREGDGFGRERGPRREGGGGGFGKRFGGSREGSRTTQFGKLPRRPGGGRPGGGRPGGGRPGGGRPGGGRPGGGRPGGKPGGGPRRGARR